MEINLSEIKSPADIRNMSADELKLLSAELRSELIRKLAAHGGHVGPNLGVVEATVALHYVFDTPRDKVVYDVSHQTYIHKMLTGRMEAFTDPAHYGDVSGYTSPKESPGYDLFEIGHTSTSISLATGLAKSRDLEGGDWNVVAFIGDASLGGGMALEALNYAPELKSNFIVILNDNQRSIAENHGALYTHLKELRDTNGRSDNNIFKALGYDYIYVREGNDVEALVKAFRQAKDRKGAVLVHINTMKGEGLPVAENNKEHFHWTMPFNPGTGAPAVPDDGEDYTDIFADLMLRRMAHDKRLVVLNAGTPGGLGFTPARRQEAGEQYVDVGIAEQDAVAMAAGLAKGGARPVMGVMAPFIQRAYDQLSHDVAINDLPAVFVVFVASVFGINDVTHLGLFDIAMISNIPNIRYLAPASAEEFTMMLEQGAGDAGHPVTIRVPGGNVWHWEGKIDPDFDRYQTVRDGSEVAIIGAGTFLPLALKAAGVMKAKGIEARVINPRNLSALDKACLDTLKDYRHVITLEDGITDGGFGQKVAAYLGEAPVKVHVLGFRKEFVDRYNPRELMRANGLTPEAIAALV